MSKSQIVLLVLLTAVTLGITGCSHVGDDWKAAQAADTTEAYQDFLRQHPDSEFGVPAQERIKQLAEDRDWQQASKTDTLDAYQQFVATHADGKWAQEARVRIENFQLTASGSSPSATPPGAAAPGPSTPASTPAAPSKPAAKPAAKSVVASKAKPAAGHLVQLGAFSSRAHAQAAWSKISGRFAAQLKSLQPHYAVIQKSRSQPVVRLQLALDSAEHARQLCASLKKGSQPCIPVG
ncbi:MAG TPA: SPOR domain-containing protein [Steroidobacteraceae bacterium]|nr:SPOR domain-containing protein [Steroidobacteraceae bacterium]